jgi:hypothetical protein
LLSHAAEKEFQEMANSESFRKDMESVRLGRLHAFVKDGIVDVDAYIDFVTQFNEFIGHEPKPFRQIIDKDMRL